MLPLALAAIAFLLPACLRKARAPEVIVLQTGRLLGNVYPESIREGVGLQHYAFISGYVKQVREEAKKSGAKVVLVDLGDSLGGSFASYATQSENVAAFFNLLNYDVVALGNLDADVPPSTLGKLKAKVLCPFTDAAGKPAMPGSAIGTAFTLDGFQLRLISNFHGDMDPALDPLRFPAWFGPVREGVYPVRDYAPTLHDLGEKKPGDITLFSWMKFEAPEDPPTAYLQKLSALGVDVILAHRIYGRSEKDVWRKSPAADWTPPVSENILRRNQGFTVARIDLRRESGVWKVLAHEVVPMTANTAPADKEALAVIAPFATQIREKDEVVGKLALAWSQPDIFNLYLTALTKVEDADVVVYSEESIRAPWQAGNLHASTVFNSLPWVSGLYRVELTGEQLDKLRKLPRLRIWKKTGEETVYHVVTSEFFAAVIRRELGLPGEKVIPAIPGSEFDFFLHFIKTLPALEPLQPTADWVHEI